ncbi:hypothetical protein [Streptomyces sp. CRN 30]|uniref:hypothetical protein n=1 Tax=Streptomyces sp. CRN 30 TaxID=3075613 RepID=UPI002A8056A6|nr:hypothetical protein [Streptomyces sp. CRN 30]
MGRAAAGLLTATAAAMALTACSVGGDDTTADPEPAKSGSSAAASGASADQQDESSSGASTADQSSPEKTVAAWVTAVVKGEAKQACLLMGEAGSPPETGSEETCADDSTQGKQIQQSVAQFQESFTPDPPTENPKVEVTEVPPTDDKAEYPADKVTVDGKTLEDIILANSTGLEKGQLNVSIESSKLDDAWYVTNMDFDIG